MITIDVTVEPAEGNAEYWPDKTFLQRLGKTVISAALAHLETPLAEDTEVSLLFTGDRQIRALNNQWRQQDKATNVLSFASGDADGPPTPLLGDIVLAFETIAREAAEQDKTFEDHLSHLLVHGFLHLLGHDHLDDTEAGRMESLETRILAGLAIADPYSET